MSRKFKTKCGIAIPTTFFRSLVFFSLLAVLALPVYTFFFLTPAVEGFIIRAQEQQAVRLAVHMETKLIPDKSLELGKHILTDDVLQKIRGTSRDFNLFKVRILFPDGEGYEEIHQKGDGRQRKVQTHFGPYPRPEDVFSHTYQIRMCHKVHWGHNRKVFRY